VRRDMTLPAQMLGVCLNEIVHGQVRLAKEILTQRPDL